MNQKVLSRIDGVMREAVEAGSIAGCSAMVMHNGQEEYFGQCGWADREAGRPMTRDAIFRMFSMSKPVTAAAAMILMER